MSTSKEPWNNIQQAQQETWGADVPPGVKIDRYFKVGRERRGQRLTARVREGMRFGKKGTIQRALDSELNRRLRHCYPEVLRDNDGWKVDVPDEIHFNGIALLAVLTELMETGFDGYVFRANSTAYVNLKVLLGEVQRSSTSRYAGIVESGRNFWGVDFVNGSGILLGPEAIRALVNNAEHFDHRYPDDVAVGHLLRELGFTAEHLRSGFFRDFESVRACSNAELSQLVHIRLRLSDEKRLENVLLHEIHSRMDSPRVGK